MRTKICILITAICILITAATMLGITVMPAQAEEESFAPVAAPVAARPYHAGRPQPRRPMGLVDAQGVRMFANARFTAGRPAQHPALQAMYGLQLLNTYRVKHDIWFLERAERQGRRLIANRVEARGAWWFPYGFDFSLAPLALSEPAPWYSALSQGQATSLFIRLALATGHPSWRTAADRAFASLRLGYAEGQPWVTHRDGIGSLWLEEYPGPTADGSARVLNGHMYAMYGLWDYWFLTRSRVAASLFASAALTLARNVGRGFRNPGWASNYALRRVSPHENYHFIHIDQLLRMHALTGNVQFAVLAETLQSDFSLPKQRVAVLLVAGRHTGIRFRAPSLGGVTGRRTITLRAPSFITADYRRRVHGQRGYWYHLAAGSLRGLWVQEVPGVRATLAPVATMPYRARRSVRMAAGPHLVCAVHACSLARLSKVSAVPIGAIGWIRGRRAVQISGGYLKGWWLPRTSL